MVKSDRKQTFLAVFLLCGCNYAATAANGFSMSMGADFSSGKYGGTTSTDIRYVPFVGRYNYGPATFSVTVPYIDITGPGNVLGPGIGGIDGGSGSGGGGGGGGGGSSGGGVFACAGDKRKGASKPEDDGTSCTNNAGGSTTAGAATGTGVVRKNESGLGDIIIALAYNLIDHKPSGVGFDVTGRLKIPTASAARGLGSGAVDYAVQGDLYKSISRVDFFATFGYRILGDPSGVTFHNVFYGAAGAGYRLSSASTIGTTFNIGQSAVRLQDSRALSVYLTHKLGESIRLNIYGLKGFSERSPDWGSGITLRYVF